MERHKTVRVGNSGLGDLARVVIPPRSDLPVDYLKNKIRLPYYESIYVGTPGSGSSALLAGYRYVCYSSPQNEAIELYGFQANFQNVLVRIQFAETRGDLWVPFYSTQMTAAFGAFGQAEPVLLLPRPFVIQPLSKIQILIQNTDASNVSNTIITLVGARLREVVR